MKICILASGSKGNSTYIETESHKILLDLGKNKKYIVDALKRINVDYKDIDIILLSHLHNDHTSALETFLKNHNATLCISEEMFLELPNLKEYKHIKIYDDELVFDEVVIHAIKASHDATTPRNFVIEANGASMVQITDTGYIKSKYFNILKNRNVYLMESNHDIEMLMHGPYPDYLKKRVNSDSGHLSNKDAGFYLSKLIGDNTKKVYLMHLSEQNNTPNIAIKTVKETLKEYDIDFKNIKCAEQNEISEVINI